MNEAETRAELIDPALKAAGWGVVEGSRVGREVQITLGRIQGSGIRARADIADYVLYYRHQVLAVVEAKREGLSVTEGLGQAKKYAETLQSRYTYSTNGHGIYQVDMATGQEGSVELYPTPDELWEATFGESEAQEQYWRDRFSDIPFDDKGGQWQPRYYQHNAITKALEAIASGQDRILLTLATGTGKTAIAFQIAWKLFGARWNLQDWRKGMSEGEDPSRRPRILFLADRNILADQAFNAFSAFPDDALVRISPADISRKGRVPKNGSVFFTIFQTFMSGTDASGKSAPYFGAYPPDFFDFVVIDECHRGGANDESNWRTIMDYFSPAVQLGLTATPKRDANVDTYAYFGDPVYTYSLKAGINDGFLTPFKVRQVKTDIDDYTYTADDDVVEGEIEENKRYTETDFNTKLQIMERERKRVQVFMDEIDQREKTLVFCATQDHALAVRDLINQIKTNPDPGYCQRVTANDGKLGEQYLRTFQDNEKSIPTILTTSQKLSTGVDARDVRNIVLMRPINSMIEFKQIIGRGTRLFEGKHFFTVHDFVDAHHHFQDPEWDGEPLEPELKDSSQSTSRSSEQTPGDDESSTEDERRRQVMVKVRLADGKERTIQHMVKTSYWAPDGTPMSAEEFLTSLYGRLPELFKDEEELRKLWSDPKTRTKLLDRLTELGYGPDVLGEMRRLIDAESSDLYDVLAYVAYAATTKTRAERAEQAKLVIDTRFHPKQVVFLHFVLSQYVDIGVKELAPDKLVPLLNLKYGDSLQDAMNAVGGAEIGPVFTDFQQYLYEAESA